MGPDLVAEWHALEAAADAALRAGMDGQRLVQHLALPSFSDCQSWEVVMRRVRGSGGTVSVGRYQRWLRQHDAQKLRSPVERLRHPARLVPTMEVVEFELRTEPLGQAIERLGRARLPLRVEPVTLGLDGTCYELVLGCGAAQSRFSWWEEPPAGWEALARFADEFVEILQAAQKQRVLIAAERGAAGDVRPGIVSE